MDTDGIIRVENVSKSFDVVGGKVDVLHDISFTIKRNDFVIIYGPSGCGKSTLLHTILGLEPPSKGNVKVLDKDIYSNYSEDSVADFRKRNIGMVYQQSNWVKAVSVEQNVALPLALLGYSYTERIEKARKALEGLRLLEWANFHPSQLSSGQQQKAAFARALITNPGIIIADEPTGNLDFEAGLELMKLLQSLTKSGEKTVLMVTHDLAYLQYASKAVRLFDGRLQEIFTPGPSKKGPMNNIEIKKDRSGYE